MKQFKVAIEGPLWYDILQIANRKFIQLQEQAINRNFISEVRPLLTLTKALTWDSIGSSILKKAHLVNIIKIQGKKALGLRQVLNTFYRYVINLKD